MKRCISLLFMALFLTCNAFAQRNIQKEKMGIPMFDFQYTLQFPGGDMKERFGLNSSFGGGFQYKTKNNWLVGIELNYMFSQNVKNADSLLWDLEVHPGEFIISRNGAGSEIRLFQRGMNGFIKFGRLFSVLAPNPNSGFFVTAGLGYMGHKIKIDNVESTVAYFDKKDYLKGYDRYTTGFALSESVGYMFLSNHNLLNFYVAANFVQGFTKNRRTYNFDERKYTDQGSRTDLLYGIRVGWIFTIYQRAPKEYYYD